MTLFERLSKRYIDGFIHGGNLCLMIYDSNDRVHSTECTAISDVFLTVIVMIEVASVLNSSNAARLRLAQNAP